MGLISRVSSRTYRNFQRNKKRMPKQTALEYEWAKLLYEKCLLDREEADYYAVKLSSHSLSITDLPDLTSDILKNVGVRKQGHCMAILKYSRIIRNELSRLEDKDEMSDDSEKQSKSHRSRRHKSRSRSQSPAKRKPTAHLDRNKKSKKVS